MTNAVSPHRDENDCLRSVEIRLSVIRFRIGVKPISRNYMVNVVLITKHVVRISTRSDRTELMDVNSVVVISSLTPNVLVSTTSF